uniref:NACHT, LRR and PYD domains-containing protein 3-like isoform X2 n=1 Tax=Myxine glutinosa TaxID=7769 RepID=UPI00358ECDEB
MSADGETIKAVKKLRQNRPNIVEALLHNPSPAFDEAIARSALSWEEYDQIVSRGSKADEIRQCLDTMDGKGEACAEKFLAILHDLRGSYPRLRSWVDNDGQRSDTCVRNVETKLDRFSNEKLLFLMKMEKSSLSEELWKEFPKLCCKAREAGLLPQCFSELFGQLIEMNADNRVDFLLNLILEGGPKNACTFWHILECDGRTRVVVEKTINKLKTNENMREMLRKYVAAKDDLSNELMKRVRIIKDYNAVPGESTDLEDRFVEPIIIKSKFGFLAGSESYENSFRDREHNLKKFDEDRVTRDDMFERQDPWVDVLSHVVVFGAPGVGKTMFSQKVVFDWTFKDGKLNKRFDFVLLFKCRNLNNVCSQTTLRDIVLNEFPCLEEVVDDMLKNSYRLLLILDALDEMKHHMDFDNVCRSPWQLHSLGGIMAGLLKGNILKCATIMVTTKLVGLRWLNHVNLDPKTTCAFEIMGFSKEETQGFFRKFYKNEEIAKQVFHHLLANDVLASLCFNPIFCWITATCLGKYFSHSNGKMSNLAPKTMTELFSQYILLHLEHHGGKIVSSSPDTLLGLCQLAFDGVKEKKILFTAEDLSDHGIMKIPPAFLSEVYQKNENKCICYHEFFHLTVQEFFAALYFFLPRCANSVDMVFARSNDADDGRYQIVRRFLSGLLAERPRSTLLSHFESLTTKPKKTIYAWLKQQNHKDLNCFHCLYELQDTDFTQAVMGDMEFVNLTQEMTSPVDCTAVVYALQTSNKPVNSWYVELGSTDSTQRMKILAPAFLLCEKLQFVKQPIGDDIEIFVEAMLSKPNRLKDLTISACMLSTNFGPTLRMLINHSNLEVLDLFNNPIGDEGLESLAVGLLPCAKLQCLLLRRCNLSHKSAPVLSNLINNSNLKVLELEDADPVMERHLKFKRGLDDLLLPYKELHRNLRQSARQLSITHFFSPAPSTFTPPASSPAILSVSSPASSPTPSTAPPPTSPSVHDVAGLSSGSSSEFEEFRDFNSSSSSFESCVCL